MANISSTSGIAGWSTTEGSNQPDGSDAATVAGDMRAIQAAVRYLYSSDTIASATTTDLGSKAAENLTISGVTTITSLGTTGVAGQIKTVVFSGALTLTHNGTSLILPTGANITTVANDAAVFLCLGSGNWRCLSYLKYDGSPISPSVPYLTSVSGTNTVTASYAGAISAYAAGQTFTFIPANTNTGATTLNINSLGAKNVYYLGVAVTGGEIKASVPVTVVYDGTQFNIVNSAYDATQNMLGAGKNKIINGNFDIWQRGTSFANPSSTYTVDRWYCNGTNTTISQSSASAGQSNVYWMAITPSSATNSWWATQAIEKQIARSLAGNTATLSFTGQSASGTNSVSMEIYKNSTADTRTGGSWTLISTKSVTLTTTPQKFSLTVSIPSDGTAEGVLVQFIGTNNANGVAMYFKEVQLELGPTASQFTLAGGSVGGELALCQRYYYRVGPTNAATQGVGWAMTTTTARIDTKFPVQMRTAPTAIEQTGTAGDYGINYQNTGTACSSVPTFSSASVWSGQTTYTVGAVLTAGNGVLAYNNGGSGYIGWSAEL